MSMHDQRLHVGEWKAKDISLTASTQLVIETVDKMSNLIMNIKMCALSGIIESHNV